MFFPLTGSSRFGTFIAVTAVVVAAERADAGFQDSDETGVPSVADTMWRQEKLEQWVLMLEYGRTGRDMFLTE